MKTIITGANGFLGQHLALFLADKGFEVHALARGIRRIPVHAGIQYHSIELTDVRILTKLIHEIQPDAIVHTAAMSKPDECDVNRPLCLQQNVDVTRYLIEAAQKNKTHFIYVSTDFIFGEGGPHEESDLPMPLNFYGQSKLMAENLVTASGLTHSIVRPVFIYGKWWNGLRGSFIHWVQQNLEQGKRIQVVTDQFRTPTYVVDLCYGIAKIIKDRVPGTFHLAGKDIVSPYDMAVTVANVLKLDSILVEPVTADSFPEPVRRAKRSGLKIGKAHAELDYNPVSFAEGVRLSFFGSKT